MRSCPPEIPFDIKPSPIGQHYHDRLSSKRSIFFKQRTPCRQCRHGSYMVSPANESDTRDRTSPCAPIFGKLPRIVLSVEQPSEETCEHTAECEDICG